ncbi:hypothetical protein [Streptomyces sp. NPDC091215]|uniref:hypothetical protein n=1 Tax=Streptomyces sp. NPDC091215 TaxID=3155192 RepID=UPI003439AF4F
MPDRPPLPSALDLTRAQFDGWACVWCGMPLRKGAVSAGRAEGMLGEHDMSIEVYACPACAIAPRTPGAWVALRGRRDDGSPTGEGGGLPS